MQAVTDAESALREATHSRDDIQFLTNENKKLSMELKERVDRILQLEE